MATPENRIVPEWSRQDRQGDLAWIGENLSALAFVSQLAYADAGRGALFIDVGVQPLSEPVQLFGYLAQLDVERVADEDTVRMVQGYNPDEEFVLVIFKEQERSSTYRVRLQPPGYGG
jgi:arylamine N-acetyltransferase